MRYLVRVATTDHAVASLALLESNPQHDFWADDSPYDAEVLADVIGHRQVTDVYLAAAAAGRGSQVATFDRGLVLLRPRSVLLVP